MAKEVIIELKAKTDNIEREVEGINQEIKTLNKNVDKTADGFEGVEKATKDTAKGVKSIGTTLKAIGIGLLLAAFTKLKEVFEQNQKVTDAFNIAFETLSIAFNDFFRFLENNLGTVTGFFSDIFENPKESLIEFGTAIKNNIIERFNSFLDTLGFLASAVKKVFSGDFAGALEDVKEAGKESLDVLTGVDDSFDKTFQISVITQRLRYKSNNKLQFSGADGTYRRLMKVPKEDKERLKEIIGDLGPYLDPDNLSAAALREFAEQNL